MPKLPSDADFGARPAPRAGGQIVSFNPVSGAEGAVADALGQFGRRVENVGDALHQIDQQLTKARQASQLSDAVGKATAEIGNLEIEFQRDQDFKTAPKRFMDRSAQIFQEHERSIDDATVREAFATRYREIETAKRLNVVQSAFKKEADYNTAALDRNLNTYATVAANAANIAEREIIINQARIDIATQRRWGWITQVDAGNRERAFLGKIDQAIVTRDMTADPEGTAVKLATDPEYVKNIDPKQRETLTDQAWRRADSERKQRDAEDERARKARGDELMKEAQVRMDAGTLTREYIDQIKSFIEPSEHRALLTGMAGADRKDDPVAFAEVQGLLDTNPAEAKSRAFVLHRQGLIRNETLSAVLSRSREISRQEGPRTPYERERLFITNAIKPSDLVPDPSASARYALVMREFDDYALDGKRTDAELRDKADSLLRKYTMVDMIDLARKTAAGARPNPQEQIDANIAEAARLMQQKREKLISEEDFRKKMGALENSTKAAEKALNNGGK